MADPSSRRRRLVASSTLGAGILLAAALFLIVNYFGWKYHQRLDWTRSRLYTLSEKSLNVLAELDGEVEVSVFLSPVDELYDPVVELLSRYEAASPRISVRVVDPEKNLAEAQSLVEKYELAQLSVVVFDDGEARRVVDVTDLADYDYSGYQFGEGPRMTGFKGEQVFTGTVLELREQRKPKILFTTGHGERGLDDFSAHGLSAAREILGKDNFEFESWASLGQPAVPPGTDLVVVAGPTSSFVEPEILLLRAYLDAGGRLLVLLDPTLAPGGGGMARTGLEPLLAEYGVEVGDDVVVDPANPLPFFGAETIFVNSYGSHVITRPLSQAQLPVIVPLARSVRAGEAPDDLEVEELMRTSAEGWGETDLANLTEQVEKGEADVEGPVSLAVVVSAIDTGELEEEADEESEWEASSEGEAETEGEAAGDAPAPARRANLRMVVIGDSEFASNGQMQSLPNATLLANALNWLVERESLVAIPAKQPEQMRLTLTASQLSRVSWLVLVVLPGAAVLAGLAVYWRRRR